MAANGQPAEPPAPEAVVEPPSEPEPETPADPQPETPADPEPETPVEPEPEPQEAEPVGAAEGNGSEGRTPE
jgi:hypothetical protein